jgi:hypothetical protein
MIDDSNYNNDQSDIFMDMVTTISSLYTNITSEKNESEDKNLKRNREYLNGNCCSIHNIGRIDNALKNMHKRWSTID